MKKILIILLFIIIFYPSSVNGVVTNATDTSKVRINFFYDDNKESLEERNWLDSYLEDKESLMKTFKEIINLDLDSSVSNEVILEYLDVIKKYNVTLEIKRLEKLIMEEVDLDEQIKISNQIRKLKMGSENNDKWN